MTRRLLPWVLAALLLTAMFAAAMAAAAPADSSSMVTDYSQKSIKVDARFHGERIYFFGTVPDPAAEVVVKLVPVDRSSIKLTRKGRVVLFWMGVKQYEVQHLPYLYKIHSSKPLKEILTPEIATKFRLGYQTLKDDMILELIKGTAEKDDPEVMFEGFVRLKEEAGLYNVAENRIRISKGRLFEHYFRFPDKAKEGVYLVESYAIKDGQVIAHSQDEITVQKVGIIAWLYRTSQESGWLYGILAVIIALGAGLLVGVIFKGGGH